MSKPAPTSRLYFRLPGRVESLGSWLAALLPGLDRGERRGLVESDRVQVDGRGATSANQVCPAGAKIEIELAGSADSALGVDAAAEFGLAEHWFAWVEDAPWASGELKLTGRSPLHFDVVERCDSLARIEVQGEAVAAQVLCSALAAIDLPVVGDLANGGLGVPGGARVAQAGAALPKPEEIVWQWDHGASGPSDDPTGGTFVVSDETARVLAAGHRWILPDDASDSAENYRRGALVRVTDRERRGDRVGPYRRDASTLRTSLGTRRPSASRLGVDRRADLASARPPKRSFMDGPRAHRKQCLSINSRRSRRVSWLVHRSPRVAAACAGLGGGRRRAFAIARSRPS